MCLKCGWILKLLTQSNQTSSLTKIITWILLRTGFDVKLTYLGHSSSRNLEIFCLDNLFTWDHFRFCIAGLFNVFIFTFHFFQFLVKTKSKTKIFHCRQPDSVAVSNCEPRALLSNQLITEIFIRRNQRKLSSQIRATFLEIILFNLFPNFVKMVKIRWDHNRWAFYLVEFGTHTYLLQIKSGNIACKKSKKEN